MEQKHVAKSKRYR